MYRHNEYIATGLMCFIGSTVRLAELFDRQFRAHSFRTVTKALHYASTDTGASSGTINKAKVSRH